MDYSMSINHRNVNQPGGLPAFFYDFAGLAQWQKSSTGSAEAAQRIRSWVAASDSSAQLDLGQLDLRSCPPLPSQVQNLCLAFNPELDTLPQPLPAGLKDLNINFCNFKSLPHDWPAGLIRLMVVTNKVTEIPETLPAGLQALYMTNNKLKTLHAHLPHGLRELYLATNGIVEVNADLLSLPDCRKLNLCNNPLSETSLAMLEEHTGMPAYAGPAVKLGYVGDTLDRSRWLPESRSAEMRDGEGPPVVRRAGGNLAPVVNAMLRAHPHHAVASYSDQHGTVLQSLPLHPEPRGTTSSYPLYFTISKQYATQ